MQRVVRDKSVVDRSSYVAYLGAGAAIAFIAAMTFGAIDAPPENGRQWTATQQVQSSTQIVSATGSSATARVQ